MKLLLSMLISTSLYAVEAAKQPPISFGSVKPSCTLIDGKLILGRAWPLGSWEDCAYSVLQAAFQLDAKNVELNKKLEELSQPKK